MSNTWREEVWPLLDGLKAILFDVDGTLYSPRTLRTAVMQRFVREHLLQPRVCWRNIQVLRAYRRALEYLRHCPPVPDLTQAQIELAAQWATTDTASVRAVVQRWMETDPLPLLRRAMRPGLIDVLESARRRGLPLGVVSDYKADRKLDAMGLRRYFDVVISSQDAEVGRLKPDPRGVQVALRRMGVATNGVLYIGDRPDVDAALARRAGLRCMIVGSGKQKPRQGHWTGISDYAQLNAALCMSA